MVATGSPIRLPDGTEEPAGSPYDGRIEYEPTSERLSEDHYQASPDAYLIYLCHLATYDFARPYVDGKRVLDFGCGTGYGTHRLAPSCSSIVGVDISADAVSYASSRYVAANLSYQAIKPLPDHPAPFADGSFEAIVSFQVIEHIWDVDSYARELHRLLAPGGTAVIATPDRATRLFKGQRPWNLFHVIEYDDDGLRAALAPHFESISLEYMTADPRVAQIELRRARQLRLVTYPMTFPHAPEQLRVAGLGLLKRLQARRSPATTVPNPPDHGFDLDAVHISATPQPSLNLIAVAKKGG